jgi:hypothetical protein
VRAAPAGADELDLKTLLQHSGLRPWTFRQPAPFELPDVEGRVHRARDYPGKVVILYMFALG